MLSKDKNNFLKKNSDISARHSLSVIAKDSTYGITLIALVVTIIVLIILAGISINLILGDNGIITKAGEARQVEEIADLKEKIQLEIVAKEAEKLENTEGITQSEIEKILSKYGKVNKKEDGTIKSLTPIDKNYEIEFEKIYTGKLIEGEAVVGEIVTGKNKKYTKNGIAVIPVGFAIVPGLDDVSAGLVISDVENDTNNIGNQFVWIPVDKETFDTKFKRTEGYWKNKIDSMLSICGEADGTGMNSKVTEDETVANEAIAMYASVKANGGFYIGRYEAGNEGGIYNSETGKWEGNSKVVVKKNAQVYNYIGWSDSADMTDVTGGAVEVARGMYTGKKTASNENYGVVSTLCYGVQWDATMNFIDPNYITNEVDGKPNCSLDSYLVNSIEKGNYYENAFEYINASGDIVEKSSGEETLIPTGSAEDTKVKNIYDMAGNVFEWTMESYSSGFRIGRGRIWIH